MVEINNLTKEQKEEISELSCPEAYGFEGPQTFPNCEECIVCLCKKELEEKSI